MKILQVIPYFTPARGGDVNVCYNLSKNLVKLGHEVTIATTDFEFDSEYAESIEKDGVEVMPFKCLMNLGLFLYSPEMKKWSEDNLNNFQLVHLHQFRSYQNNIIHSYANKYGIPYVLQPDNSLPRTTQRREIKGLYDYIWGNRILKDLSKLIAISKEETEYARQMGIDNGKISTIYTGIDVEQFENLSEHGKFKKTHGIDGKMILYLGRIQRLKGIDFPIKALKMLIDEVEDVVFVIAGPDYEYKVKLEKLIDDLNIKNIIKFTGPLSEDEKVSAYVDADLFVHTVIYMGGVGITPLEAILCDTPVIVTEQCGEIIKEAECGYLVNYGDTVDLKEKMKYVIENPEEQKMLIERGKSYIKENLSWDRVAQKIENVYHELNSKEGN